MGYLAVATPFIALLWLSCAGRSDVDLGRWSGQGGDDAGAGMGGWSGPGGAAGTGSGASAGSSDAGADNPANTLLKKVSMACLDLSATPCSVSACLAELTQGKRDAELFKCEEEFSALIDCTLQHPFICAGASQGYLRKPNSACQSQADTHAACLPVCSESGTSSTCSMSCTGKSTWAVKCHPQGGVLQCDCTNGPKAGTGTSFPGSCLGLDMRLLLDEVCA